MMNIKLERRRRSYKMRKSCVKHLSNELFILCLWRSCFISRKRLYLPKIKQKVSNIKHVYFYWEQAVLTIFMQWIPSILMWTLPVPWLFLCIYLTYIIFVTILLYVLLVININLYKIDFKFISMFWASA